MTDKPMKIPGPDHPIVIERNSDHVTVKVAGRVIVETRESLLLREANYPPVRYFPPTHVNFALLQRSTHHTYCPYKGDCSYYSIPAGGDRAADAVWLYETPYAAVAEIKDHVAFYPNRVDSIEVQSTP
jgi:uncharacterized protein (DUF427 family)